MPNPDQQPGRKPGGLPLPLILGGIGVVVVILYLRHRSGSSSSTQQPLVPAVTTDPNTGLPVDPLTGLPYITSQPSTAATTPDIGAWALQAEQALVKAGYSPALASQAIYDYTNQNQLNASEAGAVNKALGLIGFAPGPGLPFLGNVPTKPQRSPVWLTPAQHKALSKAQAGLWKRGYSPTGKAAWVPKFLGGDRTIQPIKAA